MEETTTNETLLTLGGVICVHLSHCVLYSSASTCHHLYDEDDMRILL